MKTGRVSEEEEDETRPGTTKTQTTSILLGFCPEQRYGTSKLDGMRYVVATAINFYSQLKIFLLTAVIMLRGRVDR
jgi:hypothetical protein